MHEKSTWEKVMSEIELRDWSHFKDYVFENFGGRNGYIFRGQADRDWKLESTLTRLGHNISKELTYEDLEVLQLRKFIMQVRGMRGSNPQSLDLDGMWSLGQHYGLYTPLLDWTESVYVAVYFAFENSISCKSNWRTIYVLNHLMLFKEHPNIKNEGVKLLEPLHDDNKRITAQSGLFTKSPTGIDLESWLVERGLERYLTKLYIEDDYRLDVINDLKLMNITAASIYPDIHGASKACNMYLENISDNYDSNAALSQLLSRLGKSKE